MIKVPVEVPKNMMNFCKTSEAKEKPYNICLMCPYISESCDGPNVLAMEYSRWIEWVKERLKKKNMSRQELSDASGVPVSTIASALAGTSYDIKSDTMRRITRAILGGCWGMYPCHFAALLMDGAELEDDADAKRAADLEDELSKVKAGLDARIKEVKEDAQVKINYLKGQIEIRDTHLASKNRTITVLTALVAALGALSIVAAVT